jgi:hypothetical protein
VTTNNLKITGFSTDQAIGCDGSVGVCIMTNNRTIKAIPVSISCNGSAVFGFAKIAGFPGFSVKTGLQSLYASSVDVQLW